MPRTDHLPHPGRSPGQPSIRQCLRAAVGTSDTAHPFALPSPPPTLYTTDALNKPDVDGSRTRRRALPSETWVPSTDQRGSDITARIEPSQQPLVSRLNTRYAPPSIRLIHAVLPRHSILHRDASRSPAHPQRLASLREDTRERRTAFISFAKYRRSPGGNIFRRDVHLLGYAGVMDILLLLAARPRVFRRGL